MAARVGGKKKAAANAKIVAGSILDAKCRLKLAEGGVNMFEIDFSDADLNETPEIIQLIDVVFFDRGDKMADLMRGLTVQQARLFFSTPFLRKTDGEHPMNYWWKACHYAARFNRLSIIQEIQKQGGDVFNADGMNKTILHYACEYNHFELAKFFAVRAKALINLPDMFGLTPFMFVCQGSAPGNIDLCRQMIMLDADVTVCQRFGYTPLMYAVRCGCEENVKLLLNANSDCNVHDNESWTPLHLCAYFGFEKIAANLIIHGAETEARNKEGATPLSIAAQEGRTNVVQLLITRGANVNTADNTGMTPLMFSAYKGHVPVLQALLKTGIIRVTATQQDGFDALMLAVQRKNIEIVKILAERMTAPPNCKDNVYGNHALILAARTGEVNAVTALLVKGMKVNQINDNGQSAILYAAENGDVATIKRLLESGADKEETFTENNWTPLMIASWFGHVDACRQLLDFGANVNAQAIFNLTALHLAAYNNRTAVVEMLVKSSGIKLNACDEYGFTALHWAVQFSHTATCQILLAAGCNANIFENGGEYLPLHTAVINNDPAMIGLLVKYGARINGCQVNGRTPVMFAVMVDNDELVKLIINRWKADLKVTDFTGNSALSLAIEYNAERCFHYILTMSTELGLHIATAEVTTGYTPLMKAISLERHDMARDLLEIGSKIFGVDAGKDGENDTRHPVNARDKEGKTPLFLACELVDIEAMKVLIQYGADPTIVATNGQCCLGVLVGKESNEEALKVILNKGTSILNIRDPSVNGQTPLIQAIIAEDDVMVNILLNQHGGILDVSDNGGRSALLYALEKQKVDIVEKLVKLGADTNQSDKKGTTPMHIACSLADPAAIQLLADRGANPTNLDASGKTPIHYLMDNATRLNEGKTSVTDLEDRIEACLRIIAKVFNNSKAREEEPITDKPKLENVADVVDSEGNTVLHLLVTIPQPSIKLINLVIALGASVIIKNKQGQTVLESVFSVSKLITTLAQIIEPKWRALARMLLLKAGDDDEKIDGEISMIEYSNFGLESQQSQMMIERWVARCQSVSRGASLGLRELADVADEIGVTTVKQVISRQTGNKKPVFRDSVIHAIESALARETNGPTAS